MDNTPRQRCALLVINERSRRGQGSANAAVDVLERGGLRLQRESCLGPDALSTTIRRAANSVDLVVLGGCDGTLNAAAPALIETGLPLGILPLGTANDLARTLGIPTDLGAAGQIIVDGQVRRIDLGEVNGKPFFNVASLGLSARMTRELTRELTRDVKQRWGRLGYAIATIRALAHMRHFSAEIRYDGTIPRVRTVQISVGRHYGGGMTVEADAVLDDARVDLYSLELDRLWKLALIYPAFRTGRQGLWQEVRTVSCADVEIRTRRPRPVNTDGELTTETPARFRVLPKAVAVLAPLSEPEEPAHTGRA